jgi:hypothetical protein
VVIVPQGGWLGDFYEKTEAIILETIVNYFCLSILERRKKERKKEEKERIISARDAHCKHSTHKKTSKRKSMLRRKDGDREEKNSLL